MRVANKIFLSRHINKFRFAEISTQTGSVTSEEGYYCLRTGITHLCLYKTVTPKKKSALISQKSHWLPNWWREFGAFCNSQPLWCCNTFMRFSQLQHATMDCFNILQLATPNPDYIKQQSHNIASGPHISLMSSAFPLYLLQDAVSTALHKTWYGKMKHILYSAKVSVGTTYIKRAEHNGIVKITREILQLPSVSSGKFIKLRHFSRRR
jgi:hypothetical protein